MTPLHYILLVLMAVCVGYYIKLTRDDIKYEKRPEVIRQRQKEAFDKAHEYTNGQCCCNKEDNG